MHTRNSFMGALSIEKFGEAYGIGRSKVFEEISSGRLATFKVGRRRLISIEAADAWRRALEKEEANECGS